METLTDKMARDHDMSDCTRFVDANGEVQSSSDTPDRIGDPPPPRPPSPRPTPPPGSDGVEVPF